MLSNIERQSLLQQMAAYKAGIDKQLARYARELESSTSEQFGEYPLEAVKAFTSLLERGGKRIRGSLAMVAYEAFGGTDKKLITDAACALEFLNTYILMADDIQDRSFTRRGGKTAHIMLRDYHQAQRLSGNAYHFGEAIAINGFLIAHHYAANILGSLHTDADTKLKAMMNVNKCFIATAHGQTLDVFNEVVPSASEQDINNVLEWKTAYYTFINPLQLGAILAGADDGELNELAEFGLHAGRTFQLTDDIIGTFGNESESGKNPFDDLKEGKKTLLIVHALKHAPKTDAYYLEQCLGNQDLTMHEFIHCKKIIEKSGALAYAREQAELSAKAAVDIIVKNTNWPAKPKQFLIDLVQYLVVRKA